MNIVNLWLYFKYELNLQTKSVSIVKCWNIPKAHFVVCFTVSVWRNRTSAGRFLSNKRLTCVTTCLCLFSPVHLSISDVKPPNVLVCAQTEPEVRKASFISVIRWKEAAICWRWLTSFCRCFHLPILLLLLYLFCFTQSSLRLFLNVMTAHVLHLQVLFSFWTTRWGPEGDALPAGTGTGTRFSSHVKCVQGLCC